jgi:hypothetical protein
MAFIPPPPETREQREARLRARDDAARAIIQAQADQDAADAEKGIHRARKAARHSTGAPIVVTTTTVDAVPTGYIVSKPQDPKDRLRRIPRLVNGPRR